MKCPTCATTQKRKEGMKCAKCSYVYAFDPKSDGIADGKFLGLIKKASANDTQYFTFNQLYAVYCRGRSRIIAAIVESKWGAVGFVGLVLGLLGVACVLGGCATEEPMASVFGVPLVVLGIVLIFAGRKTHEIAPSRTEPPGAEQLHAWVTKWEAAGKPIARLLQTPSLHHAPAPYRESDIYDYGVERILVVEHDILVDLFVKNNQHAEQRALVIAESGYPSYLLPHARRLLEQRPNLPVVLFHDATPHGTQLAARLRQGGLLPLRAHRLIDAGLFPKDVARIGSLAPTLPGSYGNAARADYLPFGAMAAGLAGVVGVGILADAAMAHAAAPPPPPQHPHAAGAGSSSGSSDFSSDTGTGFLDGSEASSGAADFGSSADGGDADFG